MAGSPHHAYRTVIEQIEVALEADDVHLLGVSEVARNIIERVADIRPPGGLQFVVLGNEGRIRKLTDIPAMVEVQVTDHDIFDVVSLQSDLLELCGNGIVLCHFETEPLGKRSPPAIGIGNRFIVVSGIDDDIALGMLEHIEAHGRPIDIALTTHLQGCLREASQRTRRKDV
ncbi:hypothetical protein AC630_05960 [Bradyrhizobium sp. AS23.2]|nr:hypothetical protein AC630_05960 [Bradyrhizobium sp. AS23.2]